MNLSSSTAAAPAATSRPITPVSQQEPTSGDRSSTSYEQYRSPLVTGYYAPNYATLRCSTAMDEPEDAPEVPPLPDEEEHSVHQESLSGSSPLHYR